MHRVSRALPALALAAAVLGSAGPAMAGGHVAIALTPPMAVMAPPNAYIPPPVVAGQPGAVALPQPLPPQVTYWTPPQAVPVIIQGHGRGR
jgi:hypothetical protein